MCLDWLITSLVFVWMRKTQKHSILKAQWTQRLERQARNNRCSRGVEFNVLKFMYLLM